MVGHFTRVELLEGQMNLFLVGELGKRAPILSLGDHDCRTFNIMKIQICMAWKFAASN